MKNSFDDTIWYVTLVNTWLYAFYTACHWETFRRFQQNPSFSFRNWIRKHRLPSCPLKASQYLSCSDQINCFFPHWHLIRITLLLHLRDMADRRHWPEKAFSHVVLLFIAQWVAAKRTLKRDKFFEYKKKNPDQFVAHRVFIGAWTMLGRFSNSSHKSIVISGTRPVRNDRSWNGTGGHVQTGLVTVTSMKEAVGRWEFNLIGAIKSQIASAGCGLVIFWACHEFHGKSLKQRAKSLAWNSFTSNMKYLTGYPL